MQKRKLQVFVSSTYPDLIEERQAAVEAILTAGHIPAGMELFAAGDEEQMKLIERWIDESDVYLLIIGTRYGSIDPKSNKAYTELEYDYAVAKGKRHFVLVVSDDAADKRNSKKKNRETDNPAKLREFVSKARQGKIVRPWEDIKDIQLRVNQTLYILGQDEGLKGWVKADSSVDLPKLTTELAALGKENRELRTELLKSKSVDEDFGGWPYESLKAKLLGIKVSRIDREDPRVGDNNLVRALAEIRCLNSPENPITLLHLLLYARFDDLRHPELLCESEDHSEPVYELIALGLVEEDDDGKYPLSPTGKRFVNRVLHDADTYFPYSGEEPNLDEQEEPQVSPLKRSSGQRS